MNNNVNKLSLIKQNIKQTLAVDDLGYNKRLLSKLKDMGYLTSVEIEKYDEDNIITHEREEKQKFIVWVRKNSNELQAIKSAIYESIRGINYERII